MKKTFVLDTNVLLHDPQALFRFEGNDLVIPMTVIEEIDRFKKDSGEVGNNARQISRLLDELRMQCNQPGALVSGIELKGGGILRVVLYTEEALKRLPPDLRYDHGDNRILAVAMEQRDVGTRPVIFVTRDTNLRLKADAINLSAEDYESDEVIVENDFADSGGYIVLNLPSDKRSLFHDLLKGFEDFARLKGYEVNFSIDSSFKDKIAFKFTVFKENTNVGAERLRRDFKEYLDRVNSGGSLDDMPIITSPEEHYLLMNVFKCRVSFLQHSYNLSKINMDIYEKIIYGMMNAKTIPSHNILVNAGGTMDLSNYNSLNSSSVTQGDYCRIQDSSLNTSIIIGDTFSLKKSQIDKIDNFVKLLKNESQPNINCEAVVRDVEKVKDELQDEPHPDPGRIAKWLERAKQTLKLGSLGHETVSAAKELFSAFGIN